VDVDVVGPDKCSVRIVGHARSLLPDADANADVVR
jgi:hypothetical protein